MEYTLQQALQRKETIAFWARYTVAEEQKAIKRQKIGYSHELINSLSQKLNFDADGVRSVSLGSLFYGRFVDMGVGRGQGIGDKKQNSLENKALGLKGRHAKKWYSKTVFKQISILKNILREKYSENAAQVVRETLTSYK